MEDEEYMVETCKTTEEVAETEGGISAEQRNQGFGEIPTADNMIELEISLSSMGLFLYKLSSLGKQLCTGSILVYLFYFCCN